MSRDIRSFFLTAATKKHKIDDIQRNPTVIITDDEDEPSPTKSKKVKRDTDKSSKSHDRVHSKKRIISSDEDEKEAELNRMKKKKAKVASKSNEKKLQEVSVSDVFSKKPASRVNAPKVQKKSSEESAKKDRSKPQIAFDDDDNFDETLNQLDTSNIEVEYIATLNGAKSQYFEDEAKKKDKESQKKGESESKDKAKEVNVSNGKDKNARSPRKNKTPEKSKSPEKSSSNKVHDNDKAKKRENEKDKKHEGDKKKKGQHHSKLEIVKEVRPQKTAPKEKSSDVVDYNDIIEEKIDKRKNNAMNYQRYLNRGGARNPGSKEVPKGAEDCFANTTFLVTGVLESLERDEVDQIIQQYGGKVVHTVSRKLNYMIVGEEAGPSKMAKAESLGINMISEDEFLDLLRKSHESNDTADSSNKRKREASVDKKNKKESPVKDKSAKSKEIQKESISPKKSKKEESKPQEKTEKAKLPEKKEASKPQEKPDKAKVQEKKEEHKPQEKIEVKSVEKKKEAEPSPPKTEGKSSVPASTAPISDASNKLGVDHMTALVEKYRPKQMKQIIGQNGDKSNAKKLHFWLKNWHNVHGRKDKPKPKYNQRDDTGMIFKAALLSGPPGIGKTTTAYVVCAELGFEVIEFNASDTRSKKLLQTEISTILRNKTVKSFLNAAEARSSAPKHVLLMDEVDGMAGNEDRGGMQELISFIKATEIPIICICNDRQCQKVRTLANYTFDLRFQKPRLEQIRAAMMSVCYKEGIAIKADEVSRIIQSTNQDIRQVLNHIAVLSASSSSQAECKGSADKFKNVRLGPWDVIRKVFSADEHKTMSIHDKSDLFFHDYSFAPLWVEENYLSVSPHGPRELLYEKLARCSESLAIGDVVERSIRNGQNWGLLPVQAFFSSVLPGSTMSGSITGQLNWPSWLGKNSSASKHSRLLQEITAHSRVVTGASKEAVALDYVKMLVDSVVRPLAVEGGEGVDRAVEAMNRYHLSRDDLDSLLEVTKWPHTRDLWQAVDSKTKAAFTRAYNKSASFHVAGTIKKKRAGKGDGNDDFLDEEDGDALSDDEDDDKLENDKLVKAKAASKAPAASTSRGRAKKPATKSAKKK